jgi:hypothetical protein
MSSPPIVDNYQVQDLPDRYIKIRTLEAYINARSDEFGKDWSLQTLRDHHRLTLKRFLRPDEIEYLQRTSYPAYFRENQVFED